MKKTCYISTLLLGTLKDPLCSFFSVCTWSWSQTLLELILVLHNFGKMKQTFEKDHQPGCSSGQLHAGALRSWAWSREKRQRWWCCDLSRSLTPQVLHELFNLSPHPRSTDRAAKLILLCLKDHCRDAGLAFPLYSEANDWVSHLYSRHSCTAGQRLLCICSLPENESDNSHDGQAPGECLQRLHC